MAERALVDFTALEMQESFNPFALAVCVSFFAFSFLSCEAKVCYVALVLCECTAAESSQAVGRVEDSSCGIGCEYATFAGDYWQRR